MSFTDIFIRRPVLSIVISIMLLLIGGRALLTLPVRQYPLMQNTVITVTTTYPGAPADLMQGFITHPLEDAISSTEGIDYLTSSSTQGASTITINVLLNYDPNKALTEVLTKINQVKYELPKQANDPIVTKQTGDSTAALYLAFSSSVLSSSAISDYVDRYVTPRLATVQGVASADPYGGQSLAMRLWLDPAKMASRGISATDVSNAILANNYLSAPGQAKGIYTITNIRASTDLNSVDAFRHMVIKSHGDALVRFSDIADVELAGETATTSAVVNGHSAIVMGIAVTPDGNPLIVVKQIVDMLPELQRSLPPSIKIDIAYDSTNFIKAAINEVSTTLILAIITVIVIIFLFLGELRSTLIPVVTIPLSLVGAAALMAALGFSLNLLTLLAMVLVIGLVVDDAIVVLENIRRLIDEGKSPTQAAILGAREISGAIISMTITLAAVYAPIGLIGGITGSLFREFAFTVVGAVLISGVVALTLSPMMCSVIFKSRETPKGFARLIERLFRWSTDIYARLLATTLRLRWLIVVLMLAVAVSIGIMLTGLHSELAPDEDQGVLLTASKAPAYSNLDYMNSYNGALEEAYKAMPETKFSATFNGSGDPHTGISFVMLAPWEDRKRTAQKILPELQQRLSSKVNGMTAFAFSFPPLPGTSFGLPIQMVVTSTGDYPSLYRIMEKIKDAARKSGLFIVVDSDLNYDLPGIHLDIDRAKAASMGVTMQEIGDTLALLAGGNYVNRFELDGRAYETIPEAPRGLRIDAKSLTDYYVFSRNGNPVPLSTIVHATHTIEPNALTRYNQLNSATFQAVPLPSVSMGQAVDFLNKTAADILPVGFEHDFLSESRQYVHEGNALSIAFLFSLIIIYLVLAVQYESWRDPLVVLVTVPLSMSGALLPLFFWLASLNIYTEVGLVTLIGLISKHGILMVSFARQLQLLEGLDRRQAIERAAVIRLRPIMMTTAAMIGGLFPLLIASGAGAASRFSIGVVIFAGMSIGTLFTLFVLPTVYTVLAQDHRKDAQTTRNREIEALAGV